jgi:tetratricopeptide (TPR) repeat protein
MPTRRPGNLLNALLSSLLVLTMHAAALQTSPSDEDFQNLSRSASNAREAGKTEQAIQLYQRAVDVRPDWEEGWWYLGTLLYDQDHFAEAIPALEKLVQMDKGLSAAWNFLGLCEFETHDYDSALEHLEKGTSLGPGEDPEIARVSKYHLALLLIREGEFEKARSLLVSSDVNIGSQQVKAALGLCLLRIPLLPEQIDPAKDGLIHAAGEAASLLALSQSERALSALRALVHDYPRIPYAHYAYGSALASLGRAEEALQQQREELKNSPQSALVQIEISKLALGSHRQQEAITAAQAAVRLAPKSPEAYRTLASTQQSSTTRGKTLQMADSLASLRPEREARLDAIYAMPAAGRPPIATDSAKFEALAQQAATSQASGKFEVAISSYDAALKLRPEWDEGRWNLAMLQFQAHCYSDAIETLKIFVHGKPNDGTAWAVMGLSEFETKDYNNSFIHLRRGQQLGFGGSPESVQLATHRLAILLNQHGEFERAMEVLSARAGRGLFGDESKIALGMSLLRVRLLPEQVKSSDRELLRDAGAIAALLQNSKYDEALPRLKTMVQSHPAFPFLHYAYGMALLSLSHFEDAEEQFRQEQTISPMSELPYVRLASIGLRTHRAADANKFAAQAVHLAPDSGEAHYLLGKSCLALGQQIAAIAELETAARIAPNSPEVHFNLAKAYGRAGLKEKEERERAIFTEQNEIAQQQRSQSGSQSYGAARDTTDFRVTRIEPASAEPQ